MSTPDPVSVAFTSNRRNQTIRNVTQLDTLAVMYVTSPKLDRQPSATYIPAPPRVTIDPMQAQTHFADWLARETMTRGIGRSELARRTGASRQTVGKWLEGSVPRFAACVHIADALGLPPEQVLAIAGHPVRQSAPLPAPEPCSPFDAAEVLALRHVAEATTPDPEALFRLIETLGQLSERQLRALAAMAEHLGAH